MVGQAEDIKKEVRRKRGMKGRGQQKGWRMGMHP